MTEKTKAEVRLIASQKNWMEGSAVQQLERTATLAGMRLAVGLPDLHPGKVSPIGAAFVTEGWVYPALVGNDIGCGIALWRTGLSAKAVKRDAWADRLRGLDGNWDGDPFAFLRARGIETSGFEHSLGTIGSGNHFGELQIIEKITGPDACGITPDSVYLCVHSGSRGFGEAILRDHTERFGAGGLEIGGPELDRYLNSHGHAKQWASANRELIALRMLERLKTEGERLLDICHNHVDGYAIDGCQRWIHRKGRRALHRRSGADSGLTRSNELRRPSPRCRRSKRVLARAWRGQEMVAIGQPGPSRKAVLREGPSAHRAWQSRHLRGQRAPV